MTTTPQEQAKDQADEIHTNSTKVVRRKKEAIEAVQIVTPSDGMVDNLLRLAIEKNVDMEKLQKLLDMKKENDREHARKDYFAALSRFQSAVPEIKKTKQVYFTSTKGGTVDYWYAPLSEVEKQIKPYLREFELTYRWQTAQIFDYEVSQSTVKMMDEMIAMLVLKGGAEPKLLDQAYKLLADLKQRSGKIIGQSIEVTNIVTHANGHEERNTMSAPLDDSGGKNAIQQRGSTITYAQRYTLLGNLGLGSADMDVDARGKKTTSKGEEAQKMTPTEDQYKQMIQLVKDGKRTVKSFVDKCNLSDEQVLDLTSYVPQK